MDDWVSLLETHILIIDSLPFIPLIYRSISTINEIIFTLSNSNDNYYCVTMCMHAKFCIWLQRGRGHIGGLYKLARGWHATLVDEKWKVGKKFSMVGSTWKICIKLV